MKEALDKLFSYRIKRIHPYKDDKILADWNGLMIAAFAKGAQIFDDYRYVEAACRSVNFILENMRRSDGGLFHRYRDDQAAVLANVDDYVFLIFGLIELYETTFNTNYGVYNDIGVANYILALVAYKGGDSTLAKQYADVVIDSYPYAQTKDGGEYKKVQSWASMLKLAIDLGVEPGQLESYQLIAKAWNKYDAEAYTDAGTFAQAAIDLYKETAGKAHGSCY